MSYKRKFCLVPSCKSTEQISGVDGTNITLHPIPIKSPHLTRAWCKFLYVTGLKNISPSTPHYVCSQHFDQNTDYLIQKNGKKELAPDAIPSFFKKDNKKLKISNLIDTIEENSLIKNEFVDMDNVDYTSINSEQEYSQMEEDSLATTSKTLDFTVFTSNKPTVMQQCCSNEQKKTLPKFVNYFIECKCRYVERKEIGIQCEIMKPERDENIPEKKVKALTSVNEEDLLLHSDESQDIFNENEKKNSTEINPNSNNESSDEESYFRQNTIELENEMEEENKMFEKAKFLDLESGKYNYKCSICQRTCIHKGNFKFHMESHMESSTVCFYCGDDFVTHKKMKEHEYYCKFESKGEKKPIGKWPFFSPKYIIKDHEKLYPCNECNQTFQVPKMLKTHKENVHMEAKFICEKCPNKKQFPTMLRLRTHNRIIHQKDHKCVYCKRFFTETKYKRHLASETIKREASQMAYEESQSFKCSICNESAKLSDLFEHFRSHKKEEILWKMTNKIKQFECCQCTNENFPFLHLLLQHYRKEHSTNLERSKNYILGIIDYLSGNN